MCNHVWNWNIIISAADVVLIFYFKIISATLNIFVDMRAAILGDRQGPIQEFA